MVTYAQLHNMDTSKLSTAGSTSGDVASKMGTRASEVREASNIPAGTWTGADADAASALLGRQESPLSDASDAFRTGKAALEDLVDGLENAKERLQDAHNLVAGTDVMINSDGSVTTPVVDNPATAASNASKARQAARLIEEALNMAATADDTASNALKSADLDVDDDSIPNSDDDSAEDVKRWWEKLTPAQRHGYIQEHPDKIGNLDGIPAQDRHNANMETLRHDAEHGDEKENAQDLLDKVEDSQDGPEDERIYLLGYEPPEYEDEERWMSQRDGGSYTESVKQEDARVIAAVGNPDEADHTGIVVPGMGSDLENSTSNIGKAERLNAAANEQAPDDNVSSIMWMGYDAPDGLGSAMSGDNAQEGGQDLRDFTHGLDAHNPHSHDTVSGHSYGSSVVGTADAIGDDGLRADDTITVGSPGVGYDESGDKIDNQDALNTHEDHVWTGLTDDDPIQASQIIGNHGTLPHNEDFDANRFSVDGSSGHSEYHDEGSEALENQARIMTENYDDVEEHESTREKLDRNESERDYPNPAPVH